MMNPAVRCLFLSRVVLKNYRSIEACDVRLGSLVFLVGPNGSGKSNFVDALRLTSDALNSSLDHALRDRGGIHEVRRRSSGHPTHFAIRLEFILSDGRRGHFAFEVGAKPRGEFIVKREECFLPDAKYIVEDGKLTYPINEVYPPVSPGRLYLVNAAGLPQFRLVFDELSRMGFYNVNPDAIRALQSPDAGEVLRRDGSNLASVVARLGKVEDGSVKDRIAQYLGMVVPGLVDFNVKNVGHMETLEFRQHVQGARDAWRFPAINMSDGTLRALATLVALFQATVIEGVRFVGIEEPETALHPAAAGILRDCIMEASSAVQVLVTSHSAELLDDPDIAEDAIKAVDSQGGKTFIASLDSAGRSALRDRLYTAGELLRANQLYPDMNLVPGATQLDLFGSADA